MKILYNKDIKRVPKPDNDSKTQNGADTIKLTCLAVLVLFTCQALTFCFFYQKFLIFEKSQQSLKLGMEEIFRKDLRQSLSSYSPNGPGEDRHRDQDRVEEDTFSSQSVYHSLPDSTGRRRTMSKREISAEDELSVQLQSQPTDGTQDKSWLQLTSYARIPYNAIQEFCSRTRDSCPAGPKGQTGFTGDIGFPGEKGIRGDRGLPGVQGIRGLRGSAGIIGPPGKNGFKGIRGVSGRNGVDGRDGLPGEPGLDGIPGRNGLDGMPGIDGAPGFGEKGVSGYDGENGIDGRQGDTGRKGESGSTGLTGPRGRPGKDGTAGLSGLPGINTWLVNGTTVNELLKAPTVPGIQVEGYQRRKPFLLPPNSILDPINMYFSIYDGSRKQNKIMIVREEDNVRLNCKATGRPAPIVAWSREDGRAIAIGRWKDASISDETLNLTYIRRDHTGTYRCDVSNGIPPDAHKTFKIEVYFDPFIKINEWKVAAENGTDAVLECYIEAFPIAVVYWEDETGRILENSLKHRVEFHHDKDFVWKSYAKLTLKNITNNDYGKYYCVAKNDLSTTRGLVKVYQRDPSRQVPATGSVDGLTFGPNPPRYTELFNDLCPPPVTCPTCKDQKMELGRSSLYCLRVQQFGNGTYPGYSNRTTDCLLSAVGKAVFHRQADSPFAAWLRDPLGRQEKSGELYWTTSPADTSQLCEYRDKISFSRNKPSRKYALPVPFVGSSHVIYNGSFFYHESGASRIVRYDLSSGTAFKVEVPLLASNGSNYLYVGSHDYIDFNSDDNGLWAIYGEPESNNTIVLKIDPLDLKIEYSWNISISHHKFGEMFIVCGVLYGIDSATEKNTKIRFSLDLYKKTLLDVDLPFHNPFSRTTVLGYNHKRMEIYSSDKGNQLTYPIKVISIGYGEDKNPKSGP